MRSDVQAELFRRSLQKVDSYITRAQGTVQALAILISTGIIALRRSQDARAIFAYDEESRTASKI